MQDEPQIRRLKRAKEYRQMSKKGPVKKRKSASPLTPSTTKRCCKADLKQKIRVGEILEIMRVDQTTLNQYNRGNPIRARFMGDSLFDLDREVTYRSVSRWVKDRLTDIGALSSNSNISGYDYCAVRRDGNLKSIRLLEDSPESNDQQTLRSECDRLRRQLQEYEQRLQVSESK